VAWGRVGGGAGGGRTGDHRSGFAESLESRDRVALDFKRLNRRLQHGLVELQPLLDDPKVGNPAVNFGDIHGWLKRG
jgi:hypothetical protein